MNFKVSLMSLASTLLLATPVTFVAAGPAQAATWPCGDNNKLSCHSLPCVVGDTEYSDHCVSAIAGPGTAGPAQQATPLDARARIKGSTAIPAGPSASTAKPKPTTGTPTTSPAKPIP